MYAVKAASSLSDQKLDNSPTCWSIAVIAFSAIVSCCH